MKFNIKRLENAGFNIAVKQQTKDRLMTAGTVLLICSVGVGLPGCAAQPRSATIHTSNGVPVTITQPRNQCTTDFDCEMHLRKGTTHQEWNWKKALAVVGAMAVTGYLIDHAHNSHDSDNSATATGGIDVYTPGVTCVAAGCAR